MLFQFINKLDIIQIASLIFVELNLKFLMECGILIA